MISTTVVGAFAERVRSAPEATALLFGETRWSYQELDRTANVVAGRLLALGARPGQHVAVLADRSACLVTAQLAAARLGCAFLPIDPATPADRIAGILADARPVAAVTEGPIRLSVPVVDFGDLAATPTPVPVTDPHPELIAYVIYTSGTTGVPKGVQVPHRGLANLVRWHQRAFEVTARDRAALVAGPGFDASVWEIWPYLTAGASIAIPGRETRESLTALRDWLVDHAVTICFLPTPIAEALLGLDWPAGTALRIMLTGGDRLTQRPRPGVPFRVVNNYGPTECSVVATSGTVEPRLDTAPTIGVAIDETSVYLLDERLGPVPAGQRGEIYLGGAGVATGYLDRPGLTAAGFVPDPFSGAPGARMYRTGDLARLLPSGQLEFVGRADTQVKVRGFRVELGEIEAVLGRHPAVLGAAVVLSDERLVAYVVPADHDGPTPAALTAHLAATVPDYMVPASFRMLPALPLTPNGKVDRAALPAAGPIGQAGAGRPPSTPTEAAVLAVWQQVLGVEPIGVHDDFLALGGNSLRAMRAAMRIEQALGRPVPPRLLFAHPTVAGLAARIEATPAAPVPPIVAAPAGDPVPLSFAQQRLWFIDRLLPGTSLYNAPLSFAIDGPVDVPALGRAINEIVRRHEVLRTHYAERDGEPVQHRAAWQPILLHTKDLSRLSTVESKAVAKTLRDSEARTPFDLATGPVLRATLVHFADDVHELLVTVHHIAFDGWSIRVFLHELGALYAADTQGRRPTLAPPPAQYADVTLRQHRHHNAEGLAFWRRTLDAPPAPVELPGDRSRPASQSFLGAKLRRPLPPALLAELESLAGTERASLFMVMFAAFQALLHRYTGQHDFVVGVPVAGRDHPDTASLIGFFTNTLPLRADLSADPDFTELLRRVRRAALDAYVHADVPLEQIVGQLRLERDSGHNPLFQTLFVMQEPVPVEQAGDVRIALTGELDNGRAKFDLSLSVEFPPAGPVLTAEYATDLFDAVTVDRLLGHYLELLAGVAADPARPISRLPLLSAAERALVLANTTGPRTAPPPHCLHTLVEAQAARTPAAVAVELGREALTYRELDRRANQLAHRLRRAGVGPDVPVALCLDRSTDLAVAVLGILKAGGAYVPLDPSYPAARLAMIMADVRAPVLVAHEHLLPSLPELAGQTVIRMDADRAALDREPGDPPATEVAPEHLAYVLFTSGSTGRPKGVAMPHAAIANLLVWQRDAGGLAGPARTLQFAAIGFDVSCQEMFGTWVTGGTLVLVRDEVRQDVEALLGYLDEAAVERLFLPFVALQQLAQVEAAAPARLRDVITAGEQLRITPPLAAFLGGLPNVTLHNHYGPTESHVVTAHVLHGDPAAWPPLPPIGRPIANVVARILDATGQPAPIGVPGELHLGGACLARGYYQRDDLTADRFGPDLSGQRLYRTGDLARLRADGTIEFLGRADDQVKIRGFRVEPGEVEAVLSQHPAVRDALVTARGTEDRRLVAYVLPHGPLDAADQRQLIADYRAFLLTQLPEYQVPGAFVLLDTLPRTPSGKVDRRALPEPGRTTGPATPTAPPDTSVAAVIAMAWCDVLQLESIGGDDDFFAIGGHSLLATRAGSWLRDALDIDIPLRALFDNPTPTGLAAVLAAEHGPDLEDAAELYLMVAACSEEDAEALLNAATNGGTA